MEKNIGLKIHEVTSKRPRSLDTRIYEMNIQFWAVEKKPNCHKYATQFFYVFMAKKIF